MRHSSAATKKHDAVFIYDPLISPHVADAQLMYKSIDAKNLEPVPGMGGNSPPTDGIE